MPIFEKLSAFEVEELPILIYIILSFYLSLPKPIASHPYIKYAN